MPELAYCRGVFGPISEATVSIEDRGFQFGDGVYEVIVAYNGSLFHVEEHMKRLRCSLQAVEIAYDFEAAPLVPIIEEGLRLSGLRDAMVYIQVTRGAAARIHHPPSDMTPTVVMTFKEFPKLSVEARERGARMITLEDPRWSKCYVKAVTLLPNVLAKMEARRRGCDDTIFIAPDGQVRECTSANVFIVTEGTLTFPPRDQSVLHGVTQAFVLTCAASIGVPCTERPFDVAELQGADEVIASSTAIEVLGVTTINSVAIADGRVGDVTRRLHQEFLRRTGQAAATVGA